ncbi:MAG: TonB family protein / TonB-dependent receptor [Labilithrix sp.]|nr:TonB family protein / TonB-dependent receptor [Labilithrix sp.]
MGRASRIAASAGLAIAIACIVRPSLAQRAGTDVGGQPARRKVTKLPKLTKFVEAEYPADAKAAGVEAAVVLTIEIAATGAVANVTVAQSAGADFDAAAVAAARQFVFEPAEVDDKPAPAKITYRYSFTIKEEPPPPPPPVNVHVPVPVHEETEPDHDAAPAPASPAPPAPDTVEIRGRPKARRETNQTTIRAEQARKVAGTQGDVLKVVQNLPGVSRPPVASGQIVVWGSAPRDTRVYVDGVDIPALYHGSGLRSVINSDLVSSIDLVPGAFGAEYGRGLGGLVRVETRALPRGTHGYVGADTLDGSALVSTELSERVRVAVSARQSWLDRVLSLTSAPDVGDFFPIPRYRDGQIKATVDLRKRETVDAVLLGATDDLTRTVPSPDPASTRSEANHTGFWRAYVRYTNVSDDGDTAIVTPFFGRDSSELVQRFGPTPARLDIDSTRYGVRASMRSKLGSMVSVTTGLDTLGTDSDIAREGSLTLPPREGDVAVFGQPPGDEYAADTWRTNIVDVAPHAYADVRLGPVTVTPGARFDAYLIEGSRKTPRIGQTPSIGFSRLETAVAPRLSARWELGPRLAFTAAYGTYHQAPEPEDLSPVFGTPDLALSRATHVTAGESLRITQTLSAEIVGFHKTMKDLVVRSRLANPLLARALTQNGEGRSYGVQLLLRQELWKGFFGWISYAISRSERRFDGDESWRAFDFDQPHVLSVVASQEVGRWSFGARFRYASGNPRTPVIGSTYDARNDRYDPVFGPQNSIRIPAFWQLDVRVDRSFALGETTRLLLFADVQNVTNRENAEEIVYSPSFRQRSRITGLPTIAVIGARLDF